MQEVKTYLLKCKNCGGVLNGDEDGDNIIECPFCGSKELIIESDAVKIARIKANKEVELGRQKLQAKKQKRSSFKRTFTFVFAVILLFLCVPMIPAAFGDYLIGSGVVAVIQTGLLAAALVIGFKTDNRSRLPKYFVTAAAVLIIPFCALISHQDYNVKHSVNNEAFDWDSFELSGVLPKPDVTEGVIYSNNAESLSIEIAPYTSELFRKYVSECKNAGFTTDQRASSDSSYEAYNEEGYHLELYFFESSKELSLYLDAPIEMSEFLWPSHGLAKLLPAPSSNIGKIKTDSAEYFYAYIGEMTMDDYSAYTDACIDAGFDVDYSRSDKYFSAKNADGATLSVDYEGFKTISIRISRYKN